MCKILAENTELVQNIFQTLILLCDLNCILYFPGKIVAVIHLRVLYCNMYCLHIFSKKFSTIIVAIVLQWIYEN